MHNSISSTVQRIGSSGLATPESLRGCTTGEINALERACGHKLPASYKELLALCGNSAGKFLVGTDWTYERLTGLQGAAATLLRECGVTEVLPEAAFVFAMHQGYQFLYFNCDAGEDPPVWLFVEGDKAPGKVFEHLSDWLHKCVDDEIAAYADL